MGREDPLAGALAQLDAACARLRSRRHGDDHDHEHPAARGRGGVRLAQELGAEEREAVEAWTSKRRRQRRRRPLDAIVAEAAEVAWTDADADEVDALVARFKQLRARKAGLEMRKIEHDAAQAPQAADAQAREARSADPEALRAELARAQAALGDPDKANEALDASRGRIRALRTRLDDLDGHIRDLRAVGSSAGPKADGKSNDGNTKDAAAVCEEFARKATAFESAKRNAAHSSADLRPLREKVDEMRKRLEVLQEEARVKQLVEAALRVNMTQAVASAGAGEMAQDSHSSSSWQARAMAKSLALLVDQGGEMLLNDWKRAMAETLDLSSAKVIQFVYGLVANSLVSIDRTQKDARVIAHLA